MSEKKSLKDQYKIDEWNLFFCNDEINKCKGTFVLHVVDKSPTFESWICEEKRSSVYTIGYFRCEWKRHAKAKELK